MKKIALLLIISAYMFGSVYDEGEIVSLTHQNLSESTCFAGNEYDVGDNWKLLDWNGAENGGHYNVIFIEMSATW